MVAPVSATVSATTDATATTPTKTQYILMNVLQGLKGTVQVFVASERSLYNDVIAQGLRTAGQGTPVLLVQFFQGGIRQGLNQPRHLMEHLQWLRADIHRNLHGLTADALTAAEKAAILELWHHADHVIRHGKSTHVILDEVNLLLEYGLVSEAAMLDTLQNRSHAVDVVLTGNGMPEAILLQADQVTEYRS
jgi:cob(I)alamin adenosyltransferase